ncbi:hypothetical protein GCM10010425_74490 [Streptomyces spororaveus]|uniref:Uncharacterized protein n=1 Tax=Streptomyces spororaveus TaxID=284039 RepID=A0ABQ3T378_9ACTN|nr:hypothetical protein Sspor_00360 [Streptomyces spororaveus]
MPSTANSNLTPSPTNGLSRDRSKIPLSGEQKFGLGDIILSLTEHGACTRGQRRAVMIRFAEEIGLPVQRLERYRRVAAAWPPEKRHPEVSWTVHEILAPYPGRSRLLDQTGNPL